MKTRIKIQMFVLLIMTIAFGPMSYAEVSFSSYVKRNYKVLKETESDRKTVAFQEKKMFREVASVPSDKASSDTAAQSATTDTKTESEGTDGVTTPASEEKSEGENSSSPGPNR